MKIPIAVLAILWSAGCSDMPTPAELSRPQILAVQSEPPVLGPGGASTLRVLLAGPDGLVGPERVQLRFSADVGTVNPGGTYVAPAGPIADSATVSVEADVDAGDRVVTLHAIKSIDLGAGEGRGNPELGALWIDGREAGEVTSLLAGSVIELDADPDLSIAWYSNGAVIDQYRDNPTVITETIGPAGVLIAVARDGQGGVAWKVVELAANQARHW